MSGTVLVTGGRGFIGQYVVRELLRLNYRVRVVDKNLAANSLFQDQPNLESVECDIRDKNRFTSLWQNVDYCIALAARSAGIRFFNTHPGEMLNDNTEIISSTFEAARKHSIGRMIYVSSSCAYDRSPARPITEDALNFSPVPTAGYPFSKIVGEAYCQAYLQQFGLKYTVIRPFNVYGPGDTPGAVPGDSHVIPDLVWKALHRQTPLEIFGDGEQTRCFTHVSDIARGIVKTLEEPRSVNEDFNLGHPREISVKDLAAIIWNNCAPSESLRLRLLPTFPQDVRRRAVDISKAKTLLEWAPQIDLEQGIAEYAAWIRQEMSLNRMMGWKMASWSIP